MLNLATHSMGGRIALSERNSDEQSISECKKLPAPACDTKAAEENFNLAQKLNIRGTPTLIMPNGDVVGGYRTADVLLKMLAGEKPGVPTGSKEGVKGKK